MATIFTDSVPQLNHLLKTIHRPYHSCYFYSLHGGVHNPICVNFVVVSVGLSSLVEIRKRERKRGEGEGEGERNNAPFRISTSVC